MKRITTLVLAVAFALGSFGAAHADGIDVKVQGQWDFAFGWASNTVFKDSVIHGVNGNRRDDDKFHARHRIRTQINFISSEYLQGVLMFEIGNINWGRGGSVGRSSGGALDADGVNVETKRAYLDWVIPNTEISVRMGIQGITLPSTPMKSPVWDADVAGIVVNAPINEYVSVVAMWLRPFDRDQNDTDRFGNTRSLDDETDLFGLLLPIKGEGWAVTPWGMYGFVGTASGIYDYMLNDGSVRDANGAPILDLFSNRENEHTKLWYVGGLFELSMFDPLLFSFEAIYGKLHKAEFLDGMGEYGTSGWFLGATLDYKMDWGTPGIFGWWASGDREGDVDDGKLGRLPVIGADGGTFEPTTFGFSGGRGISTDTVVTGSAAGTWGIGLQLADVSFIEDLSHTLRVAYYRGTNDDDNTLRLKFVNAGENVYLTRKDSVIEVNFDHSYKIYENLTAVLELGYLHLDADSDAWGNNGLDENEDAWKAQVLFEYRF